MSSRLRKSKIKNRPFSFLIWAFPAVIPAMSTRVFVAGIVGGIVMFIWNFVAHEVLPIGEMGVKQLANEDAVRSALETNLADSPGFYIFPSGGFTPNSTGPEKQAAMKKAEEQMAAGAAGVLIYRPKRIFNFPKRLVIQFATDVFMAWLAVFLLAQTRINGFGGKVGFIFSTGILAAVATNVPYANWYGFPKSYTLGQMITQIVGFLLVGIVAALILPRRSAQSVA